MTAVSVRGAGSPSSAITYRVGGREYPLKTQRNCKVCMSPHRFDIENMLIAGRTYRKIHEALPDDDHELVIENIKNHYLNGHLPTEQAATRQIVEARAQRVGKALDDSVEQLVDGVTLAQVVVQKSFEAIANGEMAPDMKDALSAAKFLADLGEYDEGGADMLAVSEAFMVYHELAEEVMDAEQFRRYGQMLKTNPVLRALAAKYDGEDVGPETVPGEVVESELPSEVPVPLDVDVDAATVVGDWIEAEQEEQMSLFDVPEGEASDLDDSEGWEEAPEEG